MFAWAARPSERARARGELGPEPERAGPAADDSAGPEEHHTRRWRQPPARSHHTKYSCTAKDRKKDGRKEPR